MSPASAAGLIRNSAGVNGVTYRGIGTGVDQLVALLSGDRAAPVFSDMHARPDGKQKAGDGDGNPQPEGPKKGPPELEVQPAQRDASCREQGSPASVVDAGAAHPANFRCQQRSDS